MVVDTPPQHGGDSSPMDEYYQVFICMTENQCPSPFLKLETNKLERGLGIKTLTLAQVDILLGIVQE